MATYKLKGAKHTEDGVQYKKGQLFESKDDGLTRKWPFKFELVESPGVGRMVVAQPEIPTPIPKARDTKVKPKAEIEPAPDNTKVPPIPEALPKDIESESESELDEAEDDPVDSVHGKDVSADFVGAAPSELRVYKKGAWYMVVDPDDGQVMNDKKLRKSNVEPFLAQYLPDAEG